MPMANKSGVSRRAWNLLRLALLWARRGGAFKQLHLRLLAPKFLKTIGSAATPRSHVWHGERELSFEKTPVVHVKMHRPGSMRFMLPCINPKVDFDMECDEDSDRVCYGYDSARKSFFLETGGEEECSYDDEGYGRIERVEEEREIDSRAEEFIAKFYEQLRLQRQMSCLE
ncbi:uncharacterized protein J3R85_016385 [Psidium guajava]|nr:uncharacterized protein J3R85_016385 [Psidium guajava]